MRHRVKGILVLVVLAATAGMIVHRTLSPRQGGGLVFAIAVSADSAAVWEGILADFHSKTGIEVTLLRGSGDTDTQRQSLAIALNARQDRPDLFLMDVAWLGQFAESDYLQPLDPYVAQGRLDPNVFFPRIIATADRHQGRLVGLPVYIDGGILYYRKDLLEAERLPVPQTWQELVDASQKIQPLMRPTNPAFYGFVWQGAQYEGLTCDWLEVICSNQGGIVSGPGGRVEVDTPANVAATQFMHDLIHVQRISPPNTFTEMREEQARVHFQTGNALFERNWPYAWALHESNDSPVRGKVGIAAVPHFAGGKSVSAMGGWHIGVSKHCRSKEQAVAFVQYVTSYEVQKKLALALGWNPGRRDVYKDPQVLHRMPYLEPLGELFDNLQPRPDLPYYTLLSEVVQRHVNGVLSGRATAAQGLAAAQEEIDRIVLRYQEKPQ